MTGRVDTCALGLESALHHPFFAALTDRASRRVGLGMTVPWEPVAFDSAYAPVPLCELEEAILVAAAVGDWGPALADLGHPDGLGALVNWSSRSFASPCNNQGTRLLLSNDAGTWFVDHAALAVDPDADEGDTPTERLVARHRRALVRIGNGRASLPTGPPGLFGFNAWNANRPGTTLFVPVTDMTTEYLNVLLVYLGPEMRMTIVDERAGGRPAGLGSWVASGRLDGGRTVGIAAFEQRLLGIMATEGAFVCHNLALAQQCLGLGGFTFSAYHSHWLLGGMDVPGFGFRFAEGLDGGRVPVGLDGLLETHTPAYARDMDAAVDAFLARKAANRRVGGPGAFAGAADAMPGVSWPDEETVAMVKAYCGYVAREYGRFPAHVDPVYNRIVSQAHHADPDYYRDRHGHDALPAQHREHFARWHPELAVDGGPPRR